jgi:hypothetical protein
VPANIWVNFVVGINFHPEDELVIVVAIGQKTHDRLLVAGEEIEL